MNNTENAIEVRNVKKHFKVYYDRGITLKDKILSRGRNKYEKRDVLKGISFHVKKGEAIGLIGKNGCGKSTTLKLLTKIIYPNEGTVEMHGRVSSLLELGAGFHPDMSGRENIYMNAAVFGLNRKEIDKRLNDIIKFSELEDFIDNPIRTYSSGMYMRLAFSVAINVDADILLVDEILAVGDISFQKKCFEKLKEIKRNGATIVIVSHSLDQIEKICDRTIWIENGLIKEEGKPHDVHEHYLYDMEQARLAHFQKEYYEEIGDTDSTEMLNPKGNVEPEQENSSLSDENTGYMPEEQEIQEELTACKKIAEGMQSLKINFLNPKRADIVRQGNQKVRFTEMYITDAQGNESICFQTGEEMQVFLKYEVLIPNARGTLCFLIYRDDGLYCYGTNTFIEKCEVLDLEKYCYLKIVLHDLPLLPGKYYVTLGIHDEQAVAYESVSRVAIIQVTSNKGEQGVTRIHSDWTIE